MEVFSVFNNVNCKTLNGSCTSGSLTFVKLRATGNVRPNKQDKFQHVGRLVGLIAIFSLIKQLLMSG